MSEQTVVLPAIISEASAVLADAASRDLTVAVRGAGLGWLTPKADLIVGTTRLNEVTEHVAGDLVARVQAGATMGHVAEKLARHGQRLSLDVPPEITVGGMLATGMAGPLRFRYGSPRDLLIGLTIVRPDGVVAHSGGKVVKNVAGYDLGKLFAGSHGTLGLIADATFRLHPLPQSVGYLTAAFPGTASAAAAVVAAANSALQPAAIELDWPAGEQPAVGVLLEGTESGVAERARQLTGLLRTAGAADVTAAGGPPAWWGQLPGPGGSPPGEVARTTFWLSRLADVLGVIANSGVSCSVGGSAGAGLLYLCPADETGLGELVTSLRALLGIRGDASVLTGSWVPADPLMRAVKDQFDPTGRFG
jgi:glycolate dehydrogenase FAD-binding subunit